MVFRGKTLSRFKKMGCVADADGTRLGITTVKTTGLMTTTLRILKYEPSYAGQQPDARLKDPNDGRALYDFMRVKTRQRMNGAKATLAIFTGRGEVKDLFVGMRHGGMKPRVSCYLPNGDTCVFKGRSTGTFNDAFELECAAGGDPIALATMASMLMPGGGGGAAGAMAGAGIACAV